MVKSAKTLEPVPGSIEDDIEKGSNRFLVKDKFKINLHSNKDKLNPAPLCVSQDKDGFYVRRSLVGGTEEYHKINFLMKDMKKYAFQRAKISRKGLLQQDFNDPDKFTNFNMLELVTTEQMDTEDGGTSTKARSPRDKRK